MKILVTFFEPFGADDTNSSAETAALLGCGSPGHEILTCRLPVSFRKSYETALAKIREARPDLTICLGQAAGRPAVSLERLAINLEQAKSPDSDGVRPLGRAIDVSGPDAIMTAVDVDVLRQALAEKDIPCQVSQSAGTFVCNSLYYRLLLHDPRSVVFVHLPLTPRQACKRTAAVPSMHPALCAAAIHAIIDTLETT